MDKKHIIGVVGGVGPYAGLDLVKKIFDETVAGTDQEHLPVILISLSDEIEDRTKFLLGKTTTNPATAIVDVLSRLEGAGATVAGIPCNTAHVPLIFDDIRKGIEQRRLSISVLNMIDETASFVHRNFPRLKKLGLLSTTGTAQSGIYQRSFEQLGIRVILPSTEIQETKVHPAIYDPAYGIKAFSSPVTPQARKQLLEAVEWLQANGAESLILGCTEIPLAIPEKSASDSILIDPTSILARALIFRAYPKKLRRFHGD